MKQVYLFTTPTCQPCKVQKPIMEELDRERNDIDYLEINAWEEKELTRRFKVRMSPTIIILKDDQVVADIKGLAPKEQLEVILNEIE